VILAPDDPQGIDLLGFGWFLMGDLPTAERLFWKALDQDPTYVPALFHLGMVAESRGDLESAVGFYQKVAALDPQGPMAQPARDRIERIGVLR
jgi:cytochrome c-type biogenesis protein CcmH/NrfG